MRSRVGARRRDASRLVAAFGAALLSACGTDGDSLPPIPAAASDQYTLGPGDQVHVITFGEQQLTGDFRVNDSGKIALPLVDSVPASGRTAEQVARAIGAALKEADLFKDPKVSVEVSAYRPFFVLGEVSKPGQYPYQPGMTVVTAVAVAGGFTYRAVTRQFSIVRAVNGQAVEGKAERQTSVQPGDVVTVYERIF